MLKYVKMLADDGKPYGSYSVMDRLVELTGLPTIEQNEIDLQDDGVTLLAPIVNGNSLAWARAERRCKVYAFQIERWLTTADDFAPAGFDQLWVADRWQARELAKTRPYVKHVVIGGHPGLGGEPAEKQYDLVLMCYLYGRREALLHQIAGGKWSIAPSAFEPERSRILAASRVGLSLHQHSDDPSLNPLRATLMSCWKLPMVFEHVRDSHPFLAYELDEIDIAFADARGYAQHNYDIITGPLEFRKVIEEAACA